MSTNGNGTPVYKRIQNGIRKRIESSELQPGDPVASERELARMHRVSSVKESSSAAAGPAPLSPPPKSTSTS
jgi:DNA-binding transcriptional MocR family regulator